MAGELEEAGAVGAEVSTQGFSAKRIKQIRQESSEVKKGEFKVIPKVKGGYMLVNRLAEGNKTIILLDEKGLLGKGKRFTNIVFDEEKGEVTVDGQKL